MKTIRIFLMLLPGLVLGKGACYSQINFEQAKKEYFNGDLNRAILLLTKSIENKQEPAKCYMYRGAAKTFLKQFPGALSDLDSSGKLDSKNDRLSYYYGKYYLMKGSFEVALTYYNTAIFKDPKQSAAYDERAVAKGMLGDFKGAIEDEDRAIGLDSTKQIFYTDRGFAKSRLKQYAEAIKDYGVSLKIEPNYRAYADRGNAYALMGLHEKAIEDYTKSIEIFPQIGEIYFVRGISYKAMGSQEQACLDFVKSKELGYAPAEEELKNNDCGSLQADTIRKLN